MHKENQKAYLIGAGIASLASAVYLIKDGKFDGKNIYIFEEANKIGGSLDSIGTPESGYIARGGRMFSEEVYSCTYDLLSKIPINEKSQKTLLDDFIKFNKGIKTNAKARLVEKGKIVDSSVFGMSISDSVKMIKILSLPESYLKDTKISDHFSPAFFETNFWFMWCTTFAFQPWSSVVEFKRYILRFIQELPRVNTMTGVRYTRYNQHDSVSIPITDWLKKNGVNFLMESRVSSLEFVKNGSKEQVEKIVYLKDGEQKEFILGMNDLVFFINGSMTTNSTFGSMTSAPTINREVSQDSWKIWKDISKNRPHFGNPSVFNSQIDKSKWESFSVTFRDQTFSDLMESFSKNKPGTGGLTTITDSNWLLTLVTPPQPHFVNQPDDINVFWGYCLYPDKKGDYVHKKMSECTGEEIMIEVCQHLGFSKDIPKILKSLVCIPCMMPYITSQFMPRKKGDRPKVIPAGTRNFAFIGQYCEIPDEVVFTVEQSVRSAIIAVYELLKIKKDIPRIYHGQYNPKSLEELLKTGINFGLKTLMPVHEFIQK
jgi:oleate hydratase